jgi:hypothetical protein
MATATSLGWVEADTGKDHSNWEVAAIFFSDCSLSRMGANGEIPRMSCCACAASSGSEAEACYLRRYAGAGSSRRTGIKMLW